MSVNYTYADGAANRYFIKPESIEYIPVKPEQSSSGTYDGGPAWKVNLDENAFKELEEKIAELIEDTSVHTSKRMMGTGKILRKDLTAAKLESWLIRNCEKKRTLESYLSNFGA